MTDTIKEFKAVYKPVEFKPEFLMQLAERQTELIIQQRELVDHEYFVSSVRFHWEWIPLGGAVGAVVGAIIGALIV